MLAEVPPESLRVLAGLAPQAYHDMFKVEKTIHAQPQRRALIASLFRPLNAPANWSERYLDGLWRFARANLRRFDGFKLVVYLDPQLEAEVAPWFPDVEFRVMAHSSEDHSPGAAWRILALSDESLEIAVLTDLDEMQPILPLLADAITRSDSTAVLRLFRAHQDTDHRHMSYIPLWAGETVVRPSLLRGMGEMRELLAGFLLFSKLAGQAGCEYGFDERFLGHVVYWYTVNNHTLRTAVEPNLLVKMEGEALEDFSISMNAVPVIY